MNLNEEELSTVRWFIERMLQPISMPPLSYPAILAVVTGFGLLAAFLINNKSSFKRKAVFILSALCATLFYQFILLNIYFTTFLGNETVSIDRYTSTGLMGLLLAAAVSILPSENEFSLSNIIAISKTYWENTIAMLLVASCGISLMANVFFYRNLSIHLGLYMAVRLLCLIFAAIAVILLSKNKFSLRNVTSFLQTRWKNTIAALLAIGCCVGLMASRFFLVDPTISLNRYTAVGLLCLFLAAAVAILPSEGKFALKNIIAISKTHWKNALAVMLVAGCCIGLLAMDNMRGERLMMNSLINVRDPEIRRNAYGPEYAPRAQAVADKWIPVMQELSKQPRPKVVVIAQEPQGFVTNNVLRFWHFSPYVDVYSPRMTADEGAIGWGVKEDLNITLANGDILHTQIDLSPDEWKEILLAHDHEFLYVYKADDNLILDYGQFFPDGAEDDMLYRIIRDESDVFFVRYDNETYY